MESYCSNFKVTAVDCKGAAMYTVVTACVSQLPRQLAARFYHCSFHTCQSTWQGKFLIYL